MHTLLAVVKLSTKQGMFRLTASYPLDQLAKHSELMLY